MKKGFHDILRRRPLETHHGHVEGRIPEDHIVEILPMGLKMVPIFFPVGGVDDEKVVLLFKTVEIGVVDGSSVFVGDDGVLRFSDVQGGGVVCENVLQKGQGILSAYEKASHVGYVEQAGPFSGGQVFSHDPRLILDGHFPAGEFHQLASRVLVTGIKWCAVEFFHALFLPVGNI